MSDTRPVTLLNQWGHPWKKIAVPLCEWPPQLIVWGERIFLREDRYGLCPSYIEADPYRYEAEALDPTVPAEIPVEAMKLEDERQLPNAFDHLPEGQPHHARSQHGGRRLHRDS